MSKLSEKIQIITSLPLSGIEEYCSPARQLAGATRELFSFFIDGILSFICHLKFAYLKLPTSSPFGQKGNFSIYLILLVVLGFAVLMVGGPAALQSGDLPSPVIESTPTPIPAGGTGPAPTASPSAASSLEIDLSEGCIQEEGKTYRPGILKAKGRAAGYIKHVVDLTDEVYLSTEFNPTDMLFNIKYFVNNKPRTILIYEGGSKSNNLWSGGKEVNRITTGIINCSTAN